MISKVPYNSKRYDCHLSFKSTTWIFSHNISTFLFNKYSPLRHLVSFKILEKWSPGVYYYSHCKVIIQLLCKQQLNKGLWEKKTTQERTVTSYFKKLTENTDLPLIPPRKISPKWQKKHKNKSIVMLETKKGTYPSADLNSRNFSKLKSKWD